VLQPLSLDGPAGGHSGVACVAELLGEEDPRLEHVLGMQAIATHWGELPSREQQIVVLYYYRGMTQALIGQQLGISQMQVSRLLARAVSYLRPRLFGQPEYAAGAVAPRTGTAGAASRPLRAVRVAAANGPSTPAQDDLQPRAADDGRPGRPSCLEPTAA
jgi:hypothetical protein